MFHIESENEKSQDSDNVFKNSISLSKFMLLNIDLQLPTSEDSPSGEPDPNILEQNLPENPLETKLLLLEQQKTSQKLLHKAPFRLEFLESKVQDIDYGIITHQPAINWDDLDDLFFNYSRLEEKLQSDLSKSKFMDKIFRALQDSNDSSTPLKSESFPLFEDSSCVILSLPSGNYLFEMTIESILLEKLGFKSEQLTKVSQQKDSWGLSALINFTQRNNVPHLFRVQKISMNTINFLKSLWTERLHDSSLTKIFTHSLFRNQVFKTKQAEKVKERIHADKIKRRQFEEEIDKLYEMQEFLKFMALLRTFNNNFKQFVEIKGEIDTFFIHSENQRKKMIDSESYFKQTAAQLFQGITHPAQNFVETDCVLCFSCEASSNNMVVYCTKCGLGVH